MADDDFSSYRSRDALAPRSARAPARSPADDPLAELARLIGQSDPMDDPRRDAERVPAFDERASGPDWADEDRYAGPDEPAQNNGNADDGYDDNYDASPSYRPVAASRDDDYEPRAAAPGPRLYARRDYAPPEPPHYREPPEQAVAIGHPLPAFLPRLPDQRYAQGEETPEGPDDQTYALEDYEEEAPTTRRRSGLVVVAAVLGLAVLGTAGAFAYRAMFGSSMLPSLPPIIKADNGPNKIVPTKPKAKDEADANDSGSGEKLVSREEQPVDLPPPVNPAPRVVSTIPIFPDPNSNQAGVPNSAQTAIQAGVLGATGMGVPAPMPASVPTAPAASIWPPGASAAQVAPVGAAPASPAASSTGPKKVHTVIIRSDQMAAADASPASPPPAPAPAPVRSAPPRAVAAPAPRPIAPVRAERTERTERVEANAPLSIVPDQAAPPPPARVRTALAQPTELSPVARSEPAATAGGGYAVQVTSQRSEAEAQAEFRALRAKYPNQLRGRQPIVRRADLGAKGVYYRAFVGPFASMEQAAGMCASLKAAGGNCIVQRE
jgi:hypothetical protein